MHTVWIATTSPWSTHPPRLDFPLPWSDSAFSTPYSNHPKHEILEESRKFFASFSKVLFQIMIQYSTCFIQNGIQFWILTNIFKAGYDTFSQCFSYCRMIYDCRQYQCNWKSNYGNDSIEKELKPFPQKKFETNFFGIEILLLWRKHFCGGKHPCALLQLLGNCTWKCQCCCRWSTVCCCCAMLLGRYKCKAKAWNQEQEQEEHILHCCCVTCWVRVSSSSIVEYCGE